MDAATTYFSSAELEGLDEPVQRYFAAAIPEGAPLWTVAFLTMRGAIRLGRWVPFVGTELLAPRTGFLWRARTGGVVVGSDRFLDGAGKVAWFLGGAVPVMRASGPDVHRSAPARCAGEGSWLPTALLPRFGTRWHAESDDLVVGRLRVGDVAVELHQRIDRHGRLVSSSFDRWGDPDGTGEPGWHRFGMEATATGVLAGLIVPVEGVVGWHHGTDRWDEEGVFFRYRLTGLTPR